MPNPSFSGWFCHHGIIDHLAPPKANCAFPWFSPEKSNREQHDWPPGFWKMNPTVIFFSKFRYWELSQPSPLGSLALLSQWFSELFIYTYPKKTNMTMESPLFEDAFPIENGDVNFPGCILLAQEVPGSWHNPWDVQHLLGLSGGFAHHFRGMWFWWSFIESKNDRICSFLPTKRWHRIGTSPFLKRPTQLGFATGDVYTDSTMVNHHHQTMGEYFCWLCPGIAMQIQKKGLSEGCISVFDVSTPKNTHRMFLFKHRMWQRDCWCWRRW